MKLAARLIGAVGIVLLSLATMAQIASAQASSLTKLKFISFNAVYHLSRDSRGVSLLTADEAIGVDFQDSGTYGITRSLPKTFNGQPVDIKVLNVSDTTGQPVPFKAANDKNDNLVITTGDPKIALYGPQTIKINYQTSGVVNLSQKADQFLLNVNGRGWDQSFASISATLYVPNSFQAAIQGRPSCYVSPGSTNCQVSSQKKSDSTIISAKATSVAAHQALVMRVSFKASTFSQKPSHPNKLAYGALAATGLLVIVAAARQLGRKKA